MENQQQHQETYWKIQEMSWYFQEISWNFPIHLLEFRIIFLEFPRKVLNILRKKNGHLQIPTCFSGAFSRNVQKCLEISIKILEISRNLKSICPVTIQWQVPSLQMFTAKNIQADDGHWIATGPQVHRQKKEIGNQWEIGFSDCFPNFLLAFFLIFPWIFLGKT